MRRIVHQHYNTSMIVLIVDGLCILATKHKGYSPVPADFHGPSPLTVSLEFVEIQARQGHILRPRRRMQTRQDQPQTGCMSRLNACLCPLQEEPLKALVSESRNHGWSVTCNAAGYKATHTCLEKTNPSAHLENIAPTSPPAMQK